MMKLNVMCIHPKSTFNYQLHILSTVEHNKYLGTVTVQPACALIIIGASLSEPHHVRSTVKSVFLLACLKPSIYG